jgi:lipoprotein-anchoring transpeptidase ErfK/SrfK
MRKLSQVAAAMGMAVALMGAGPAVRHDPAPTAAMDGPARITSERIYLTVDLSERVLYVMRDGEQLASYSVAIGQPRHQTPTGEYRIRHIVWNPHWIPPDAKWARGKRPRAPGDPRNPVGRVKLLFHDPDLYIHGTHEVDSLGEAESHGCLRMRNSEVIALAKMVMENGGSPRDPSWFRRVLDRVTATREVNLSDPVLVEIHH